MKSSKNDLTQDMMARAAQTDRYQRRGRTALTPPTSIGHHMPGITDDDTALKGPVARKNSSEYSYRKTGKRREGKLVVVREGV